MRLIDADDLLTAFPAWENEIFRTSAVRGTINACPTVDAVPVKHGRWIPVDSYSAFGGDESTWMAHGNPIAFYYCSKCKEQARAGEDGESLLTKYCPDCGAVMDGKDGDGDG